MTVDRTDLLRYYPGGVTCPICRHRLRLPRRTEAGECEQCDRAWSYAALIDVAAQRIMAQSPRSR